MKARQHERSETATGKISMGGAVALYRGAHRIGMYKFKSSGFEEFLQNDEDLLRMIRDGRELFLDRDRCSECHGNEGKGDATKILKDDNGERTWPRNLTKLWTFRASNDPRDIYSRVSKGIPGTQMPSFADPASDKVLSTYRSLIASGSFIYFIGSVQRRSKSR